MQRREGRLFRKRCWEHREATCGRRRPDRLSPGTRTNPKWIKDLNVRPETINCTEESTGAKLLGLGQHFMNLTSKAKEVKANRDHQQSKETANRGERMFADSSRILKSSFRFLRLLPSLQLRRLRG